MSLQLLEPYYLGIIWWSHRLQARDHSSLSFWAVVALKVDFEIKVLLNVRLFYKFIENVKPTTYNLVYVVCVKSNNKTYH